MQEPYSPGTKDPNTGWSVDQASGFTPPSGVGTHGHQVADIATLQATITALQAAVTANTPVGLIAPYYGTTAPTGWLLCDGSSFSAVTYPLLNARLGGTNTPDLKGKVIVGIDGAQTEFDVLGETGGSKTATASHTHGVDHDHASVNSGTISSDHAHSGTTATEDVATVYNDAPGGSNTTTTFSGASRWINTSGFNGSGKHTHTVTTGGVSANHTHAVDLPNFTGTSGASSVGVASGNLQPYKALSYIIKAG